MPEAGRDVFSFTVEEKVGLPDYSNVTIRASITREIEDSDEARREVIDIVEEITAAERDVVIEHFKSSMKVS